MPDMGRAYGYCMEESVGERETPGGFFFYWRMCHFGDLWSRIRANYLMSTAADGR